MATTKLQAGAAPNVTINATKGDVARYVKSGDNLIVEMTNGQSVMVADFYNRAAGGETHKLMFSDGTFSGVEGLAEETEEVAGLGMNMEDVGAGLAALATGLVAANGSNDD
ncbi:BapA prefix-like domain-containing protein, partial [Pseudosulfitobacter sp. DSM 107133]